MTPIIDIAALTVALSNRIVLKDITFSVQEGDYLSVLGPNGSGKSTLLKCLCRIITPPGGAISVGGRPVHRYSQRELAKWIAYVPQGGGRPVSFTVREYLEMARYPYNPGWRKATIRDNRAVDRALCDIGIETLANRPMNRLSGGERQKVLIAAALVQEAPILLLDEATAFLDVKHKTEIHQLLAVLGRKGKTIISVSHDINDAVHSSNRIIALKKGKLVYDGIPEKFMTAEVMERVYALKFIFTDHPSTGRPLVVPRAAIR